MVEVEANEEYGALLVVELVDDGNAKDDDDDGVDIGSTEEEAASKVLVLLAVLPPQGQLFVSIRIRKEFTISGNFISIGKEIEVVFGVDGTGLVRLNNH